MIEALHYTPGGVRTAVHAYEDYARVSLSLHTSAITMPPLIVLDTHLQAVSRVSLTVASLSPIGAQAAPEGRQRTCDVLIGQVADAVLQQLRLGLGGVDRVKLLGRVGAGDDQDAVAAARVRLQEGRRVVHLRGAAHAALSRATLRQAHLCATGFEGRDR